VNLRAEPNSDAEVIGQASGDVLVLGHSGNYAYLPDLKGWVRADPQYLRLVAGLSLDMLPEVDPLKVATALAAPIALAAETTPEPPLSVAASPSLASLNLSVDDPVIPPPAVPEGLLRIEADNAAQVALLGVLPASDIAEDGYPMRVPAISADGTRLVVPVTASNDSARAWDLRTFTITEQLQLPWDDYFDAFDLVLVGSPDGKSVAYTKNDYREPLQFLSLETEIPPVDVGMVNSFWVTVRFSPDGRTLAFPGGLFDVPTHAVRVSLNMSGSAIFSPDSNHLALVTQERAYIVNVETSDTIAMTPRIDDSAGYGQTASFSPDNQWLAITNGNGIFVYDAASGEAILSVPNPDVRYPYLNQTAFSPDGHYLIAFSASEVLEIVDLQTKQSIGHYPLDGAEIFAFSPDSHLLAVGNPVRLIDLETGTETPIAGNYAAANLQFTPDGATLLADTGSDWYDKLHTVMAFGVPNDTRRAWPPLTAEVVPSGINVRDVPDANGAFVGTVSGTIHISARDQDATAVYVDDTNGWVWAAPEYLNLGNTTLDMLPVRVEK
jgi:WD40 repeat protein